MINSIKKFQLNPSFYKMRDLENKLAYLPAKDEIPMTTFDFEVTGFKTRESVSDNLAARFLIPANKKRGGFADVSLIKSSIITDKTTRLLVNNKYTFAVCPTVTKLAIKMIIEDTFNVKVIKVTTSHLPKKKKRVGKYLGWKPHYKKAIVTLLEGDTIDLFVEEPEQDPIYPYESARIVSDSND